MTPDNDQNQVQNMTVSKPPLQTDYSWYNSLFTQLIAPLFGARYLFEAIEDINPGNVFNKDFPKPDPANKALRSN